MRQTFCNSIPRQIWKSTHGLYRVLIGMVLFLSPLIEAAEPGKDESDFFEKRIRPVLSEKCYECHSAQSKILKGGLRVDSREGLLRGGDTRAAIVPGDPDKSLLFQAILQVNPDLQMPPKSKLPASVAADFARWIRMGAPGPSAGTTVSISSGSAPLSATADPGKHWAFRPVSAPSKSGRFLLSNRGLSIDSFIDEKLKAKGLSRSRSADRATLARRIHFDLTGLPPSVEELNLFLNDHSRDAVARMVDRLMASKGYGERWGRWWLDIARYADSNGQDENKVMANAWRYRDWVIKAFNENLPFDRFVQMQLAGDLLPTNGISQAEIFDRYTATGFLVLGPKMLAEQDKPKLAIDIVDEQIDTTSRAFLGLTLGCARCHDHKYDPIPTRDYYAMAGVFKSTRTMENFEFVSKFNERWVAPDPEVTEWKKRREGANAKQKEIDAAVKKANEALGKPLPEKPREKYPKQTLEAIVALEAERDALKKAAESEPPRVLAVEEGAVTNLAVHIRGSHLNLAKDPVPRGFVALLEKVVPPPKIPGDRSGRLELARWLTNPGHPLTARVIVNRVWQAHFGEGLVRTPDNFGIRGEAPTHPELLDWLAREFVVSGWDLKHLHRLILLSRTYQQSSVFAAAKTVVKEYGRMQAVNRRKAPQDVDPDNRLLWHFPRQRMEAEMVRDALLAVSGRLDSTAGGSLVKWQNNEYTPKDEVSEGSRRRSVYLPIVRDRVYDALTIFDFANPSVGTAKRVPTTVSHQALFMMNSPLVKECSKSFAESLIAVEGGSERKRVELAYLRTFARAASDREVARSLEFVAQAKAGLETAKVEAKDLEVRSWAAFCQTLLCANEFLFRD